MQARHPLPILLLVNDEQRADKNEVKSERGQIRNAGTKEGMKPLQHPQERYLFQTTHTKNPIQKSEILTSG
jgi:hypothetical protein